MSEPKIDEIIKLKKKLDKLKKNGNMFKINLRKHARGFQKKVYIK